MHLRWLAPLLVAATPALADDEIIYNQAHHRQICAGVYSAADHPGPFKSQIELDFKNDESVEGEVTVVIFSYKDIDFLGTPVTSGGQEVIKYLCDHSAIDNGLCSSDDYGKVIINKYKGEPTSEIWSGPVKLPAEPVIYDVTNTNYYCVVTFPLSDRDLKYKASVHFMNAYGHLPASQLPLLWFHLAMALAYVLLFGLWSLLYWRYRADVLPVQKYISSLGIYMIVEQFLVWGYYVYYNKHGTSSTGGRTYLAIVAILGAGRLALTFFLLLIVCLGYSVVHPSLGKQMNYCRILAGAQFVAAAIYSLDSYRLVPDDEEGTLGFLAFLPLTVTMGIFYVWTLQALGNTQRYLMERKQHVKARMYRMLWYVLIGSALAIFGFLLLHTLTVGTQRLKDFVNDYWKTKWIMSDGWPNFVYLIAFALVATLWAPTDNNRRYAMSTQLAQDDADAEEFEIGSLNGSDDEEPATNAPGSPRSPGSPSSPGPTTSGAHRTQPRSQTGPQARTTVFDAESDRDADVLSDLEDDDWNRNEDRDELVNAPGGRLR